MKMCKKTMVSKLPYISLGLLFVFAGIMKLFIISPAAFAGMIEMYFGMIGLVGGVAVFVAWLIAIAELLGGVCLLFWKFCTTNDFKNFDHYFSPCYVWCYCICSCTWGRFDVSIKRPCVIYPFGVCVKNTLLWNDKS
jgi:hypothetical protein